MQPQYHPQQQQLQQQQQGYPVQQQQQQQQSAPLASTATTEISLLHVVDAIDAYQRALNVRLLQLHHFLTRIKFSR